MRYDTPSPLDVSFLYMEDATTPMHISSLAIYEDGPVERGELVEALSRRIHRVPRMRRKLHSVPLSHPVWVDDADFDLDHHVRHVGVPPPGGRDELHDLVGWLLSQPLDRNRPLWEIWVIDGLADGRFALLSKVHHAMWDGVSGAGVHAALLDLEPDPELEPAPDWEPEPAPSPFELAWDAARANVLRPLVGTARVALDVLRSPSDTREGAMHLLRSLGAFAVASLKPSPSCALSASAGAARRYTTVRTELDAVKTVKDRYGATVNDVILSTVAGGLHAWMRSRGIDPHPIEAMVPVSVRTDEDPDAGNRVAMMVVRLPTDEADPVVRLGRVKAEMASAKSSGQAQGSNVLRILSDFTPPAAVPLFVHAPKVSRFFNLVVTNVPGPQQPLYAMGRRMVELYPQAPIPADQALSVAIFSYDGAVGYGLYADRAALPDVDVLADGIRDAARGLTAASRPASEEATAQEAPNGAAARENVVPLGAKT